MKSPLSFGERFQRLTHSLGAYLGREKGFLARVEFWVYLPDIKLPSQDDIMNRMMLDNPFQMKGVSPIGAPEGMLFSDVRTHMALVLKKNNPQIFRGDNFPDSMGVLPAQLNQIAHSNAVAKVSYISEEPLKGLRHIGFITHAADAIADLGGGILLYDLTAERLWEKAKLDEHLSRSPKGDEFDLHVKTLWKVSGVGNRVETRGLAKLGLPDLRSQEMERDQQVIAEAVIGKVAESIWTAGTLPDAIQVELFGDRFKVEVGKREKQMAEVRILRMHAG